MFGRNVFYNYTVFRLNHVYSISNSGITWKNSKTELEYIAAFEYYKQKTITKDEKNYAVLDLHCVYRNSLNGFIS